MDHTHAPHIRPAHASASRDARVPFAFHVLAAAFVAWCLWLGVTHSDAYGAAMQEDRLIEWCTAMAFAIAGVIRLVRAVRARRLFDALVALFCLFVAGEEISWGQRLLGLTPPAYFLEHNRQQEMNVHNFANAIGGPKWPFVVVLLGYGLLLPLVARPVFGRRVLERLGATVPSLAGCFWLVVTAALLVWYPLRFTGEWCELLGGATFLVSSGAVARTLALLAPAGLVASFGLTALSARGDRDPRHVACARDEVALLAGVLRSLPADRSLHKRVWTLVEEGWLAGDSVVAALGRSPCAARDPVRAHYGVDPWGTAYWVRVSTRGFPSAAMVYSFGPNRRRDVAPDGTSAGDDVVLRVPLSPRSP